MSQTPMNEAKPSSSDVWTSEILNINYSVNEVERNVLRYLILIYYKFKDICNDLTLKQTNY